VVLQNPSYYYTMMGFEEQEAAVHTFSRRVPVTIRDGKEPKPSENEPNKNPHFAKKPNRTRK